MKEALLTQFSFHFSPSSNHLLPLQTIGQRLRGIWDSLTWPVVKRILKADLAVTIVFSLLLIDPVRQQTQMGIVLAQVAVEFIHPAKSYGAVFEDIGFGTVMCTVSTAWSLLGIFISSLVRDHNNDDQAQPKVSAVLACFLLIGAFFLNYLRAKVDQANLGGMLSATILVLSITAAVRNPTWQPRTALQDYIPIMVGFAVTFVVCIVLWPENSTRIYVQQLVKTLEAFDAIAGRQVEGFLHNNGQEHSIYPSQSTAVRPEPVPVVHQAVEGLMASLVAKKRIVRREASANAIAPRDVSEMTRIMKKMRVPLQGLAQSRTLEENMRKAHMRHNIAKQLNKYVTSDHLDPIQHPDETPGENYHSDHSYSSLGDDSPRWSDDQRISECSNYRRRSRSTSSGTSSESMFYEQGTNSTHSYRENISDDDMNANNEDIHSATITEQQVPPEPFEQSMAKESTSPNERHHVTIAVLENTGHHHWRKEYDEIMRMVRPLYMGLAQACSTAIQESVKRLERIQKIDRRFQDKPWLYRLFIHPEPQETYDTKIDPSVGLLNAINHFDKSRLRGLDRLFHHGSPRRILFMLLHFQFHLRGYAERVYTLSSLVYEMEQARTKRRLWMPDLSLSKWIQRKQLLDEIGIDPPHTVIDQYGYNFDNGLQRTLSRRAILILRDQQQQQQQHGDFVMPPRGSLHRKKSRRTKDSERKPRLDPHMIYHDPDVAYPTTRVQWAFFSCWGFLKKYLYSADTNYALRACVAVMVLTLPAFLEDSVDWYDSTRGQWAAVVALVWMGPSVGSNFFGLMVRTVGTCIGAICAILIWEISRRNRAGMLVLVFFIGLPWWHIYLNGKFWKATGQFSLVTTSLIIGYAYQYQMSGKSISVYKVTQERMIAVIVGVVTALIISVFPYPRTGRVELRHRIAKTLGDTAALYSSFLALLLKNGFRDEAVRTRNRKMFRQLASDIRVQIKGERVLLEQSRFEPALRGVFQEHKYLQILQTLENIVNLMIDMEHSLEKVNEYWRISLVKASWEERKSAIASILTALHLGANALSNKSPLPPYVLRPTRARRILTNKAKLIPNLMADRLADPEYTYYSTYLMSSEQLAVEIELLISTIRDLVGPDSVSVWLDYKH